MSLGIFSTLKSEYELKQKQAFEDLERKKEEIYAKVPGFKEIESKIRLLGVRYNLAILNENTEKVRELLDELNELTEQKNKLLAENGYSPDFLKIKYECSACSDTGYIQTDEGAKKCACFKQKLLDYIYKHSNLKLIHTENFDNFNINYYPDYVDKQKFGIDISPRENIRLIKSFCMEFIEKFDIPGEKGLYFCGPAGTGKTFMANCVAREILNKNRTVLYQTAPKLFDTISEKKVMMYKNFEETGPILNDIYEVELLIIDDLGTEPRSDARYAEFLNILNIREMNNLIKPCKTIISTNFNPRQLREHYDERIVSRIIGGFNIFRFAGDDIRLIKATEE
jgi:DNA replication protein DnaC